MVGSDLLLVPTQESTGSPDLPNSGRLIELEYATMDDRKLRSQLRNVSALELQVWSGSLPSILPITYLSLRPQCQPRHICEHSSNTVSRTPPSLLFTSAKPGSQAEPSNKCLKQRNFNRLAGELESHD